jgi:hypothetical protein
MFFNSVLSELNFHKKSSKHSIKLAAVMNDVRFLNQIK